MSQSVKKTNMKRVIQMTMKHDLSDSFDAESRIAGMSAIPGFIMAFSVASKAGSEAIDQIVAYYENYHPELSLVSGQRYAWIMETEAQKSTPAVELTPEEESARGQLLADMFYLKRDHEHKDRFQTTGGTHSAQGIFRTAKRYIEHGK